MFEARLNRAGIFKNVVLAFEEILSEAFLKCTKEGMDLIILDQHEVTAVRLKIAAKDCSFYRCDVDKTYGFRMFAFTKIMGWVDSRDKMCLKVGDGANCLTVCYEAGNVKREFELYLIVSKVLIIPVNSFID